MEESRQARLSRQKTASALASKARELEQLEARWNEERDARLETEERCANLAEQVEGALRMRRIYEKACEIRNGQVATLEAKIEELKLALQLSQVLREGTQDAWVAEQDKVSTLEASLAEYAESLLIYRDYYGTSLAQVKHLQECDRCWTPESTSLPVRCLDYPTE